MIVVTGGLQVSMLDFSSFVLAGGQLSFGRMQPLVANFSKIDGWKLKLFLHRPVTADSAVATRFCVELISYSSLPDHVDSHLSVQSQTDLELKLTCRIACRGPWTH